jgi:putative ABC transport system substrate-binding protein
VDRRRFLLTFLAATLATPAAEAQQADKMYRVALINTTTPVSEMVGPEPQHPFTRRFIHALRALGWIEGHNFTLERRSAEGRFERFGDIVRELVGLPCDAIVTTGSAMTAEALRVTRTVPIVFTAVDAITSGLASTLAQPDRNITGVMFPGPHLDAKRLEILREAAPKIRRVAVLAQASSWAGVYGQALRDAAVTLGLTLRYVESGPNDFSRAFATIKQERLDALYLGGGPYLYASRHLIIEFATQNRLPLMGAGRDFVEAGALLNYGASVTEFWQRTATYVDRILRGAKVADLPIEQPSKFDLLINLKSPTT